MADPGGSLCTAKPTLGRSKALGRQQGSLTGSSSQLQSEDLVDGLGAMGDADTEEMGSDERLNGKAPNPSPHHLRKYHKKRALTSSPRSAGI